jgi:hypothetical protein
MVLLQSYVFVCSISPEMFCRWSSFQAMFLCGALDQGCCVDGPSFRVVFLCGVLDQRCSVDGPPSKLCLCVEH